MGVGRWRTLPTPTTGPSPRALPVLRVSRGATGRPLLDIPTSIMPLRSGLTILGREREERAPMERADQRSALAVRARPAAAPGRTDDTGCARPYRTGRATRSHPAGAPRSVPRTVASRHGPRLSDAVPARVARGKEAAMIVHLDRPSGRKAPPSLHPGSHAPCPYCWRGQGRCTCPGGPGPLASVIIDLTGAGVRRGVGQ